MTAETQIYAFDGRVCGDPRHGPTFAPTVTKYATKLTLRHGITIAVCADHQTHEMDECGWCGDYRHQHNDDGCLRRHHLRACSASLLCSCDAFVEPNIEITIPEGVRRMKLQRQRTHERSTSMTAEREAVRYVTQETQRAVRVALNEFRSQLEQTPAPAVAQRQSTPPPTPRTPRPRCTDCNRTRYEHRDHAHNELVDAKTGQCPFGDCGGYEAPGVASDDDETAHRIQVLRDDADTLDRIRGRHGIIVERPIGMVSLSIETAAGWLRDHADRLEGDSA